MGFYNKGRSNSSKSFKHNNSKRNQHHNNTNQNNHTSNNNIQNNNDYYKMPRYYDIKIGEKNFFLSSESLNNDAPNFFTAAFFGYFQESNTSKIFIERDPDYFDMIVKYLRGYEVDWPFHDKTEMMNLLADVKFYGFENLRTMLEKTLNKYFPKVIIPWKIITYAPENEPILAVNIKDIDLNRWDESRLIYNANLIMKKKINTSEDTLTVNNDNNANIDVNNNINQINQVGSSPEKGLYKLEIHGRDAFATVTSSWSNGVKFENLTFKNSDEEQVFKVLTDSFRINNNNNNANTNANANANNHNNNNNNNNNHNANTVGVDNPLTLSPSLKLPFLKDTCIEIDNQRYHNYNDLSAYFGVTSRGKPLYFEELVIRIDGGAHLMRAKAWTIPSYYASQPFINPANQHLSH